MIAALGSGPAALLAARPAGRWRAGVAAGWAGGGVGAVGQGVGPLGGLATAAVEALLEQADLGLQVGDALLQGGFALTGLGDALLQGGFALAGLGVALLEQRGGVGAAVGELLLGVGGRLPQAGGGAVVALGELGLEVGLAEGSAVVEGLVEAGLLAQVAEGLLASRQGAGGGSGEGAHKQA